MRSTLLTTAAAAALFALPVLASAQDRKSDHQRQQSAAPESSQAPAATQSPLRQQKGAEAEHSGRSAAEQEQPGAEVHGTSQKRGAQEQLKSKSNSSQPAHPAQKAEEQKPETGTVRKPSASTEPTPGEEKMQTRQEKKQRHGEAKSSEHAPRHTTRSNAPAANEPGKEMQRPSGRMTGGNESPNGAVPSGPATGRSAMPAQGKEQRQGGAMPAQGNVQGQGGAVTLNSRQQTAVVTALTNEPVQRVDNANFALTAGTVIPGYVALNPLPESVVEIVPQYQGYDYVMVRDEIIIVEPQTRRIVTVLRGQGRSAAIAPTKHLRLTGKQRHIIMSDLRTSEGASISAVTIGERVPEDVQLLPIPEDVVSEIPVISPYSYFVTGNEVVLVAPDTREVVDVIE